jgi:hypothetical protein
MSIGDRKRLKQASWKHQKVKLINRLFDEQEVKFAQRTKSPQPVCLGSSAIKVTLLHPDLCLPFLIAPLDLKIDIPKEKPQNLKNDPIEILR